MLPNPMDSSVLASYGYLRTSRLLGLLTCFPHWGLRHQALLSYHFSKAYFDDSSPLSNLEDIEYKCWHGWPRSSVLLYYTLCFSKYYD